METATYCLPELAEMVPSKNRRVPDVPIAFRTGPSAPFVQEIFDLRWTIRAQDDCIKDTVQF